MNVSSVTTLLGEPLWCGHRSHSSVAFRRATPRMPCKKAGFAGASQIVRGAQAVAAQAATFSKIGLSIQLVLVNGDVGLVSRRADGRLFSVLAFTIAGGKIVEIDILADPARLSRLDLSAVERWTPRSRKAFKRHDSRTQLRRRRASRGGPCRGVAIVRPAGARPPRRICERWCRRHESEQRLDLFKGQKDRGGIAAIEVGEQRHVRGRDGRPRFVRWRDPQADWRILSTPTVPKPRGHTGNNAPHGREQVHVRHVTTGERR